MKVELSPAEIEAIKIWAESSIHGGHWGDNDIVIPEEDIILKKLDKAKNGEVDISPNEARIILTWSSTSLGIHTYEEEQVIKKLSRIAEDLYRI